MARDGASDGNAKIPRRTELASVRLRQVATFIQRHDRRPTRNAPDPAEKSLGVFLHRFLCSYERSRNRMKVTMPMAEYHAVLDIIDAAPNARQVMNRESVLSAIESIAVRSVELGAVPRYADASGAGRKLTDLHRVGRLTPAMRNEALSIVREIVCAPALFGVRLELERSIKQAAKRAVKATLKGGATSPCADCP